LSNKTKLKEGEKIKLEGIAARDTITKKFSRTGHSDCVFIPPRWRKFFNRKIQLSIIRKDNIFGKYALVIEEIEE